MSSVFDRPSDVRPYAEVTLFGRKMLGLMDTGASLSCLGGKAAEEFLRSGKPFKRISSIVRTADGSSQEVVGFIKENITFKGIDKLITIFIIPSLDKELFLGVDFWELFDLLPKGLVKGNYLSDNLSYVSTVSTKVSLSPIELQRLEQVVRLFPSFSKEGLGRTSVLCHSIDTEIGRAHV